MAATERAAYEPLPGCFDEAFDSSGHVRAHYATAIAALNELDLDALARAGNDLVRAAGVTFRSDGAEHVFAVDPVPRLIEPLEWQTIARGVAQRSEALNRFAADVYGQREIFNAGVMSWRVVEQAEYFEPDLLESEPPAGVFTHVSGLDLVRDADGELRVLEDNVRSPSGLTFALAARRMSLELLPDAAAVPMLSPEPIFAQLGRMLHAAAPEGSGKPAIVIVSDGPASAAWFEHRAIAGALDLDLVSIDQLEQHEGALFARVEGRLKPIDVLYRRTDLDRLRDASGALTRFGELLLEPVLHRTVAVVNAFGAGVADDKLVHAYVERMIDFYLGEEPVLRSVPTLDLGDDAVRRSALERLDELVFKPRGGLGGHGVTVGRQASAEQLREVAAAIERNPSEWVAQETVELSTHPTVANGRLEPRHVDLRPYAMRTESGFELAPACLTRVALTAGEMVVNSSQGGGAKDTWITTS